jgi:hypothetical protein
MAELDHFADFVSEIREKCEDLAINRYLKNIHC